MTSFQFRHYSGAGPVGDCSRALQNSLCYNGAAHNATTTGVFCNEAKVSVFPRIADTSTFDLGDPTQQIYLGGDGGRLTTAASGPYIGQDDSLLSGGAPLTHVNSYISGDFLDVDVGVQVIGGDDLITVSARRISGDVEFIEEGASAIGGVVPSWSRCGYRFWRRRYDYASKCKSGRPSFNLT